MSVLERRRFTVANFLISDITPLYRPCDSEFELILQFAGKNFTLAKTDILVPSYLAVDSIDLGGEAFDQCQFQAQPDDPTEDEFGPFTSITYQFGDPLLRNVAMVCLGTTNI